MTLKLNSPFLTSEDLWIAAEAREAELAATKAAKERGDKNTTIDILPSTWAESMYMLDGRPFRLDNRDYLKAIYNEPIEEGLLMTGRQVEKSTTASVKISNDTLGNPFMRTLYFAPQNSQVEVFSTDRLGRLFLYSQEDVIKNEFLSRHDKQNVHNKSFANGSLIYLRHAYDSGDNIRGLSVNQIFGDEIQDVDSDAIPVIQETQAHSRDLGPGIKRTWYSGTPKTFSNTIEQLWSESDQREWVVKCPHCNTDQILGVKNLTPTKYICRNSKCGRELTSAIISKNGRWVSLNSNRVHRSGFRITQMMNPSMWPSDVYKKMTLYTKAKFFNEVLGRSYENANKPMSAATLRRIMHSDIEMYYNPSGYFGNVPLFMGVDWGHGTSSFTVVTIGAFNSDHKWQVLYTKIYAYGDDLDREFQFQDIMRLYYEFNIAYFVADYGDGFAEGRRYKTECGTRFDMCYYSSSLQEVHRYNEDTFTHVVNRTRALTEYIEEIQNGKHIWPAKDEEAIIHMYDHHIVVQAEYRSIKSKSDMGNLITTKTEELYYTHPTSKPDDGFHSGFYAWYAAKLYYDGTVQTLSGGSSYEFSGVSFSG